jgi:hypothetical protein
MALQNALGGAFFLPKACIAAEFDWGEQPGESAICPICLEEVTDADFLTTPCHHSGHKDCMRAWSVNHNSCPVCRKPIPALGDHQNLDTL